MYILYILMCIDIKIFIYNIVKVKPVKSSVLFFTGAWSYMVIDGYRSMTSS